jgi:GH35 family endo-1,4-beta-xylanase
MDKKTLTKLILILFFAGEFMNAMSDGSPSVAASLPPGLTVIPDSGLAAFSLFGVQKELGRVEIVDATHPRFKKALRIQTMPGAKTEWSVQVVAPVTQEVKKGDVLLARFWLRCQESMTGQANTSFIFELSHKDFDKAAAFPVSAGSQWKEVFVPFQATRDFPLGEARIAFRAGYDRQTIDIADVRVVNFKSSVKLETLPRTLITYEGRSPDAPWRKAALDRIEKIRKGDLTIEVTDSTGSPIPSAIVHAVLRRHAFGFGTCVDATWLMGKSADSEKYRQTIATLFNRAVFENDMKWPAVWNGVPPVVDQSMQWMRDHDIVVRGHNLVWPSWQWLPPELKAYKDDPARLRELTAKHITDTVTHFRGQLDDWDVVNEPYTNHDLMDLLDGPPVMVDWYKLARAADPECRLFINDFGILDGNRLNEHREHYYNTIQMLRNHAAPLDGIGIQAHFGTDLPGPDQLLNVVDRFAGFGLPIEMTECSFNLQDRQLQADYLRDFTTAMFSDPAVEDIILWGFWSKRHWRPDAALYDDDWTPRPIAREWIDLTQKQWSTDVTTRAAADGSAQVRGFFGTYEVTVSFGGKTRTVTTKLEPGGTSVAVKLE